MELETGLGRAYSLAAVKKRVWYAPWVKKTVGIRFNIFFISLKQPKPKVFDKARRESYGLRHWGVKGRLGSTWSWQYLFNEKDVIDDFLKEHGGDPLPEKVMTEDGEIFFADGTFINIPQGALIWQWENIPWRLREAPYKRASTFHFRNSEVSTCRRF